MYFLILFLTALTSVLAIYDENLAREKLLRLASAAYSSNPEDCVNNIFSTATISKKVTVKCGDGLAEKLEICSGFVGYAHKEKAIFLVYRGTRDGAQLFYEIYRTVSTSKVRSPIGGLVSKYFYDVYSKINAWNRLGVTLKYLLWRYPDYKVWVTGHSLGGALASIAAGELVGVQKIPSDRVIMMSFGQPRVGNSEYVEAYEKLLPNSYRIVHSNDVVPHVPPYNFDGYRHAGRIIFYEGKMEKGAKYTQCESEKDERCSNNSTSYSIIDHIYYFDTVFVFDSFTGCKKLDIGKLFNW